MSRVYMNSPEPGVEGAAEGGSNGFLAESTELLQSRRPKQELIWQQLQSQDIGHQSSQALRKH